MGTLLGPGGPTSALVSCLGSSLGPALGRGGVQNTESQLTPIQTRLQPQPHRDLTKLPCSLGTQFLHLEKAK